MRNASFTASCNWFPIKCHWADKSGYICIYSWFICKIQNEFQVLYIFVVTMAMWCVLIHKINMKNCALSTTWTNTPVPFFHQISEEITPCNTTILVQYYQNKLKISLTWSFTSNSFISLKTKIKSVAIAFIILVTRQPVPVTTSLECFEKFCQSS